MTLWVKKRQTNHLPKLETGKSQRNKKENFDLKKISFVLRKELFISHNSEDIYSKYDFSSKPLGEGAFGVVYKGTEKVSGDERAIKIIEREKIKNFQRFYNEVNALKTLDHPHIIKLFEIYEDDKKVYLVQELCTGGELFDYIVEKEFLTEDLAAKIFQQIMQSIMYCHKNRI